MPPPGGYVVQGSVFFDRAAPLLAAGMGILWSLLLVLRGYTHDPELTTVGWLTHDVSRFGRILSGRESPDGFNLLLTEFKLIMAPADWIHVLIVCWFKSWQGCLVLQSMILGLGAWLIYVASRSLTGDRRAAFAAMTILLLHPVLYFTNLSGMRSNGLVLAPMALCLWGLLERRPLAFAAGIIASFSTHSSVSLILLPLLWIVRGDASRPRVARAGTVAFNFTLVYFVIAAAMFFFAVGTGGVINLVSHFSTSTGSQESTLSGAAALLARTCNPVFGLYFIYTLLFYFALFLPLRAWWWLVLLLPQLLYVVASGNKHLGPAYAGFSLLPLSKPIYHPAVDSFMAPMALSCAVGFARLLASKSRVRRAIPAATILVLFLISATTIRPVFGGVPWTRGFDYHRYISTGHDRALRAWARGLDRGLAVSAPESMFVDLFTQRRLTRLSQTDSADVVLIDLDPGNYRKMERDDLRSFAAVVRTGGFRYARAGTAVMEFHRGGGAEDAESAAFIERIADAIR